MCIYVNGGLPVCKRCYSCGIYCRVTIHNDDDCFLYISTKVMVTYFTKWRLLWRLTRIPWPSRIKLDAIEHLFQCGCIQLALPCPCYIGSFPKYPSSATILTQPVSPCLWWSHFTMVRLQSRLTFMITLNETYLYTEVKASEHIM